MDITYILNSRMPTEEARGIQTVRMCEGFSQIGWDVSLKYADRYQPDSRLENITVREFYDTHESFKVDTIPYFDAHPLISRIGLKFAKPLVLFGNLSLALTSLFEAIRGPSDYYITRSWQIAVVFVLFGVPTIYSAHTVQAKGFSSRGRKLFSTIADHDALRLVVANSQGTARGMVDLGVPEKKVIGLPNGVDIDDYDVDPGKQAARAKIGLPEDEDLLVYTGSLIEPKGVYALAKASEYIDGTVVLVGGEEHEQRRMHDFLDDNGLDDVIMVGHVDPRDVSWYQFAADVLALPPLAGNYEKRHQAEYTSPLKLFEYMAARRPIVASDIPALREVISDEETALLVEPDQPEAIARATKRLVEDRSLSNHLSSNAYEVVQKYTWENRARQVTERLRELESD